MAGTWTAADMHVLGTRHAELEAKGALEGTLATLIDAPPTSSGRLGCAWRSAGATESGSTASPPAAISKRWRYRLAFYGSTRSYHGVLCLHGWEELGRIRLGPLASG